MSCPLTARCVPHGPALILVVLQGLPPVEIALEGPFLPDSTTLGVVLHELGGVVAATALQMRKGIRTLYSVVAAHATSDAVLHGLHYMSPAAFRCTSLRCTPFRCTSLRCTPFRLLPLCTCSFDVSLHGLP